MIEKTDANALGIGSYGAVYRAKIGQLPCAAKILHPTLFQIRDAGTDRIRTLFEQECQVLRRIRHPHVIQYIKSFQDPDSQLPVLLMELMDESLTHYLERLHQAVPQHVQLNLAHDIALALDFLHSIDVIHRDLSSNNVLLIAGKRAKVTDFGMAKLWEGHSRMTPATICPGTMAYMPPEAFKNEPIYTEKLDCFSAGVVFIQILTRQFPNPSGRVIQVNDANYPSGIEVIIPEDHRRQADIALVVPQTHPLLRIARECIVDKSHMRPSAGEICSRIDALKGSSWLQYVLEQEQAELERVRRELSEEEEEEEENGCMENGVGDGRVNELEQQLEAARSELREKERDMAAVLSELEQKERVMNDMQQQHLMEKKNIDADYKEKIRALSGTIQERHAKNFALQDDLLKAQELVTERDTRIAELERQVEELKAGLLHPNQLSPPLSLDGGHNHSPSATLSPRTCSPIPQLQPLDWKWRLHGTARKIDGYSSAVSESTAYFADGNLVLTFNCVTGEWTTLPPCPKRLFAIAVVGGLPTAVGGFKTGEGNIKTLLSLTGDGHNRKWCEEYPPLTNYHRCPAAVSTGSILVVAGGYGSEESSRSVEVLDTYTMCWTTAASLPFPLWQASAVVCGDRVYLGGGFKDKQAGCRDVLYCSLSNLQSRPTSSLPFTRKLRSKITSTRTWHSTGKLPMEQSTLVAFQGQLYAVGGQTPDRNVAVSDVYAYSPSSTEWKLNGRMVQPRSKCFVVSLPSNCLMVLGGSTEPYTKTDSVEMASLI